MIAGVARLTFDADGVADYGEWTDVAWDSQTTETDSAGRWLLTCGCHEWYAEAIEVDAEHSSMDVDEEVDDVHDEDEDDDDDEDEDASSAVDTEDASREVAPNFTVEKPPAST